MDVSICGSNVDLQHQAIVYDRRQDRLWTAPADDGIYHPMSGDGRFVDARSTSDGLQLLYPSKVTDAHGTLIYTIPERLRRPAYRGGSSFGSRVSFPYAWDPEHRRVVRVVITGLGEYPNENRPTGCSYAIEVADYGAQTVTTYTVDWTTVRDAITAASTH
jgi:hypothetical protein